MTTRAQRAVLEALAGTDTFLSAQDIHGRLRAAGSAVGLTSVYRALHGLHTEGVVDERIAAGETGYRRCRTTHHHHLSCTSCGATVEVEAPATEAWLGAVARRHGFSIGDHVLELSGTCPVCRGSATRDAP